MRGLASAVTCLTDKDENRIIGRAFLWRNFARLRSRILAQRARTTYRTARLLPGNP
jgi:hypothetical protein